MKNKNEKTFEKCVVKKREELFFLMIERLESTYLLAKDTTNDMTMFSTIPKALMAILHAIRSGSLDMLDIHVDAYNSTMNLPHVITKGSDVTEVASGLKTFISELHNEIEKEKKSTGKAISELKDILKNINIEDNDKDNSSKGS